MDEARRRGRQVLLIIAALFLVPVLVSFALYYGKLWRPAGSASKGELIEPARPLHVAGLRNPDGTPAGNDVLAMERSSAAAVSSDIHRRAERGGPPRVRRLLTPRRLARII